MANHGPVERSLRQIFAGMTFSPLSAALLALAVVPALGLLQFFWKETIRR